MKSNFGRSIFLIITTMFIYVSNYYLHSIFMVGAMTGVFTTASVFWLLEHFTGITL